MADPQTSHTLYSQTEHDERGGFTYEGDLQRPGLALAALTIAIQRHLEGLIAGSHFAVRGETFAGGRKVIAELLDGPADLSRDEPRHAFEAMLRDQIERFGFTRSNILQDAMSCSFFSEVRIGQSYWAALAARKGASNTVEGRVPLAAFKRRVQVGDTLTLVAAPAGHRSLGTARRIIAVRSNDLVLEGPSYLTFPRASGFACDGARLRIAIGSASEPDAHLLYEWIPASLPVAA